MTKTIVTTTEAPAPIGPYNQAIIATGKTLYISGQIALDSKTGELHTSDLKKETNVVMNNLKAILEEAGASFQHVVKTSIFLLDMSNFATVNEIYSSYFTDQFPARETVAVAGLPRGVNVEISMIACL